MKEFFKSLFYGGENYQYCKDDIIKNPDLMRISFGKIFVHILAIIFFILVLPCVLLYFTNTEIVALVLSAVYLILLIGVFTWLYDWGMCEYDDRFRDIFNMRKSDELARLKEADEREVKLQQHRDEIKQALDQSIYSDEDCERLENSYDSDFWREVTNSNFWEEIHYVGLEGTCFKFLIDEVFDEDKIFTSEDAKAFNDMIEDLTEEYEHTNYLLKMFRSFVAYADNPTAETKAAAKKAYHDTCLFEQEHGLTVEGYLKN